MRRLKKYTRSAGRWQAFVAIGAALALALALSACGSSGSASTTAAAEEPTTSAAETTTEEGTTEEGAAEGVTPAEAEESGEESESQSSGVEQVKLVVKSDEEKGKKGPDGNWHDAFLPADFSVKAGATVHVTVYNYDDSAHSFTSEELGTNVVITGGDENQPSKTTFTFHAPSKAGSYEWHCAVPCDEWAMVHFGYMKGHVKVT